MKGKHLVQVWAVLALLVSLGIGVGGASSAMDELGVEGAAGTAFTYQGQLRDGSGPVNATCDLQFALWDTAAGGTQVGSAVSVGGIVLEDGLFTAQLDFGAAAFRGQARYLEVSASCPVGSPWATLPRQELTGSPYALWALGAPWTGLEGVPADLADGDQDTTYTPGAGLVLDGTEFRVNRGEVQWRVSQTCAAGSSIRAIDVDGTVTCEADDNTTYSAGTGLSLVGGQFSVDFGGSGTAATASRSDHSHAGTYWQLGGNAGTTPGTNYLGTSDNAALVLRVNSTRALRIEPSSEAPNLIGGWWENYVTAGVRGATIGGGGGGEFGENRVTDDFGTVSGGIFNQAGDGIGTTSDRGSATVGGGYQNTASGDAATVGGGQGNAASSQYATVGGGYYNNASGALTTVGGGQGNAASDSYTTVGGGVLNTASGYAAAIGGGAQNTASGHLATIGGGGNSTNPEFGNLATDDWGTVGGGYNNQAGDDAGSADDRPYATVGGGSNNTASGTSSVVAGGESNDASGQAATVGGGEDNTAISYAATVGGGLDSNASGNYATVGGGWTNTASEFAATVGGGEYNTASGGQSTVGGGWTNTASGQAATVGGGYNNVAQADSSTVGGGWTNTASANAATVPGGASNIASGSYSFAAGAEAHATHDGSFVWSSATATDSWGTQTFTVRSHGGARFYSASGTGTGVQLAAGGTSFASISDQNAKEAFAPIDTGHLLEVLAGMPVQTWNLKSQSPEMRHIGPVAQDFNGSFAYLFGEVESPIHINTMDAVGVSLGASQGLYQLSQGQAVEIAALQAENRALEAENAAQQEQMDALEARLTALEAGRGAGSSSVRLSGGWWLLGGGVLAACVVVGRRAWGGGR